MAIKNSVGKNPLPPELRWVVKQSVTILGEVILRETGPRCFKRIERLRREMTSLRVSSPEQAHALLSRTLAELRKAPTEELSAIAHSFCLMLELMNACENAFRTHRLRRSEPVSLVRRPERIVYVVTAHPTEARSPENIAIFQQIRAFLTEVFAASGFEKAFDHRRPALRHLLEIAWRIPTARQRKPRVEDEAEHIYSILFRSDVLQALLDANREIAPIEIHSWVGGDKDGHPGVNAKAMLRSLQLSRTAILRFIRKQMVEIHRTLKLLSDRELDRAYHELVKQLLKLRELSARDGARVCRARTLLGRLEQNYSTRIGSPHPAFTRLQELMSLFPGLVLPLELRESSEIVAEAQRTGKSVPIVEMIRTIRKISQGGEPDWYASSFILSMTSSAEQLEAARKLLSKNLGKTSLPVIPLFEQQEALEKAPEIIAQSAAHHRKGERVEVMLGYSDSAKEIGVLPSRLAIHRCLTDLDQLLHQRGLKPLFFHGQGGSIDRGGGSIAEQVAGWPSDALSYYKATIQGEMVDRSFATREIILGQLEKIVQRFGQARDGHACPENPALQRFVAKVIHHYQARTSAPDFMEIVQKATAYRFLSTLKMGSRPVSRTQAQSIGSLRAIPWILCWTQTRVLFPTWWGIGTAWKTSSQQDRQALQRAFRTDPTFSSYVKALGFTLAKVELPVWRLYLDNSELSPHHARELFKEFSAEYRHALEFVRALSGKRDPLWFRPWLSKSVELRSPMIHPLNLIQIIALERRNSALVRETVTGISSGMMTTG